MLKTLCGRALAALGACVVLAGPAAAAEKLMMLVTSQNTEAQAMALVLSNQARGLGAEVELLLCGPAGDIALSTAPAAATETVTPTGQSVRSLLEGLLAKGGTANVCAIYLPNRNLQPDALMDGVGVAKPQDIAARLIDVNVRVVSVD